MNTIILGIGIIIGILIRDIKIKTKEEIENIKHYRAKTQFIEAESVKDKFAGTDKIDEFIKKL